MLHGICVSPIYKILFNTLLGFSLGDQMATSNKPKPIPGERQLIASDSGILTLSNYRVTYDAKGQGKSKYISIPLDAVSSCGLVTRSFPLLLVVAAIAILFAFTQEQTSDHYTFLIVGAIFVIAYFFTRAGVISVSSSGGEGIAVPTKGMNREQILYFLESVAEARLRYTGKINNDTKQT